MSRKRKKDISWPCTVPEHPKYCPQCLKDLGIQSRIRIYHVNKENDALFMCSNQDCPWPLMTHEPEQILGKSDLQAKIKHKKAKKARKGLCHPGNSPAQGFPLDLQFFSIPSLLSPLHPSSSPLYKSPRHISESQLFNNQKQPYLYPPTISSRPHGLLSPSPKKDHSSHSFIQSKEPLDASNQSSSDFEFKSPAHPGLSPSSYSSMDSPKKNLNKVCTQEMGRFIAKQAPETTKENSKFEFKSPNVLHENNEVCSTKIFSEKEKASADAMEISQDQSSFSDSSCRQDESLDDSSSAVASSQEEVTSPSKQINIPSNSSSKSLLKDTSIMDSLTNHETPQKDNTSSKISEIHAPSSPTCDIDFDDSDVSLAEVDYDSTTNNKELINGTSPKEKCNTLNPINSSGSCSVLNSDIQSSSIDTLNKPNDSSGVLKSMSDISFMSSSSSSLNQSPKEAKKIFVTPPKLVKPNNVSNGEAPTVSTHNSLPLENQPKAFFKLKSLSNKVSMSLGQNIDLKVLPMPPPNLMEKVEELKTSILNINDIDNAEFGELMKNAPSGESSQQFLKKVQESLRITNTYDEVTFHVSNSTECSNNLPTSSLDVSTSPSGVKVMLCSESDAIEKYDLLNDSSLSPVAKSPQKRGRGKVKRQQEQRKVGKDSLGPADIDNFLANKELISNFRYHLSIMMEGFTVPREWEGIDPIIAMLASKKQNPNFAHIDIDSMMQLYAKILHYENYLSKNTSNSTPEKASAPKPSISKEVEISPECNIKHEIIDEFDSSPSSVVLSSVHPPADRSVEYIPERYHVSNGEKIGRGKHVITFDYDKSHFGPIFAESEEEVRAIVSLVQEKIAEIKCRKENRTLCSYSSSSVIAASLLPQDVLNYIRQSFAVRGLKENIVGRKVRNYQKRSEVIKIDKTTGELIYPANRNKPTEGVCTNPDNIRTEPIEEEKKSKISGQTKTMSKLERNVFNTDIPIVPQTTSTSKPKRSARIAAKATDIAADISGLLGKIDSKEGESTEVASSTPTRLNNLRPLLASTANSCRVKVGNATRGRGAANKKTPVEALVASSLYVRPNKEQKVMKLLAQKQKKEKLVEKNRSRKSSTAQGGVYKGFSIGLPQDTNTKTTPPKESPTTSKGVNKPEISKEEQELMSELLQVAEEFDRRSNNSSTAHSFEQNDMSSLDNVDMPSLDDLF